MDNYKVPSGARIGHVHLKVSNIDKSLDFYQGILGFEITSRVGAEAAFVSAGGYHHHIGLNTWHSKDGVAPPKNSVGLFHLAIVYPTRRDLAIAVKQLFDHDYPITGAFDHGVSEAIYLNDPDGNGLELYCDKPKENWVIQADGEIRMPTKILNITSLLQEAE